MREEIQRFHSITLQTYQSIMFDTLIHPHNIITETAKQFTFENQEGAEMKPIKGFFAIKDVEGDKQKYFISTEMRKQMPIRVNESEEVFFKDNSRSRSIISLPTDITPFRINAEQVWASDRDFIDSIAPFKHSEPDHWTLSKIVALMGYVGKLFCGICSLSEFGKSSIYLIFDAITKKCPLFQPRSVPGVLAQITSDGNMVFDEVHDAPSEVKSCMENFSLQVAGNSPVYINGAMKSKNTRTKYDVSQQSITYLYNVYSNYSQPEKQFWNFIWSNKKAMESRFLLLMLKGKLEEEFDKDFDIPKVAEDNKLFYIKIAKHLLYLKKLKVTNAYIRRYTSTNQIKLKGRHLILYDEIMWGLDLYCQSQQEYDKFIRVLNNSIMDYDTMLRHQDHVLPEMKIIEEQELVVKEELVKSDTERVMDFITGKKLTPIDEIAGELNIQDIDTLLERMKKNGDVFEPRAGFIERL